MQTFLPFEDFAASAAALDSRRLNSQINEAVVILRSNLGVYGPSKRTGVSGWAAHPACLMWKNHELALAQYGLAFAKEWLARAGRVGPEILAGRRTRVAQWSGLVDELGERNFPVNPMPLLGDEEFHSAFRALLLYKDLQEQTFTRWKRGVYPDHASTRGLLTKKSSWKREDYERIWEFFGLPDHSEWYGGQGWTEDPDPDRVFYTTDRVPYMVRRKKVMAEKPYTPWMRRQRERNLAKHQEVTSDNP
jgi:hypothetical protein